MNAIWIFSKQPCNIHLFEWFLKKKIRDFNAWFTYVTEGIKPGKLKQV